MTDKASARRNDWAREWPLAVAVVTLAAMLLGKSVVAAMLDQPAALIGLLVLICGVILAAAIAIVRHAEILAHRLGEPAGTLLLTLAITGLEVAMVGFVMSTGEEKPTLARDTMFAVVMLVLNGFMGLALLLGGLRHGEQRYNLFGANAFLIMILPLSVLGLVLPNYTRSTPGPMLSTFQMVFLSVMSVGIYGIFLFVQNQRHRDYFKFEEAGDEDAGAHAIDGESPRSTLYHSLMLGAYGLPLVMLAKQMSTPLDAMVSRLGAPVALGGFVLAALVLTPESIAAVKAAHAESSAALDQHPAGVGARVDRADDPAGDRDLAGDRARSRAGARSGRDRDAGSHAGDRGADVRAAAHERAAGLRSPAAVRGVLHVDVRLTPPVY